MSWRDRPYAGDDYGQPQMRIQFRKPTTVVVWLLIANIAVHFVHVLADRFSPGAFSEIFGLSLAGIARFCIWQPVTYMFVHSTAPGMLIWHIALNMLLVYFIGSELERMLGRDRFLQFYGTCGIVGGIAYLVFALIAGGHFDVPIIGASGAAYGLLLAAMIFFPRMQIIFIIFPMPIRVFGLILIAILLLQVLSGGGIDNLGGEVCHIAGALTAIGVFYAWGMMPRIRFGQGEASTGPSFVERITQRRQQGAWARKQKALADEQAELDRILAKVHDTGLASLTRKEKAALARATKRQQAQDRKTSRIDRL